MEVVGKAQVECLSCGRKVKVLIKRYGGGYVAVSCPECGKLAYNSSETPEGMKSIEIEDIGKMIE